MDASELKKKLIRKCGILALDFDGVLVDSVELKGLAFVETVADFPVDLREKFRVYHRENGGLDRTAKFRYFYLHIARQRVDENEISDRVRRFAEIVHDRVVVAPEIPGASMLLSAAQGRVPIAIVSATPEIELRSILAARQWKCHVAAVFGSPTRKSEALKALRCDFREGEALFIGDAAADWKAAIAAGWQFAGVVPPNLPNPFPPAVPVVADMRSLGIALGLIEESDAR